MTASGSEPAPQPLKHERKNNPLDLHPAAREIPPPGSLLDENPGSTLSGNQQVVPYAEQWLCSYEIWRATGIWSAPGRHPESITCQNPALSTETPSHAQLAPITAAGFVRVGRLIGTFASSALMAVASEEFYRWPRSRDWRGIGFKGVRSPHISIWLLVPPPVALSPSVSLAA